MSSPERLADWLDADFTEEIFAPDLDGTFSAEENQLLMSLFADGGTGEREDMASSEALDDDMFEGVDDKKIILASAAAAGLRGPQGRLKHAFSTGDLTALTPNSPEDDASIPTNPSLESVPEGALLDPHSAAGQAQSNPPNALNLGSLSTEQLEQELSRRKSSPAKSEPQQRGDASPEGTSRPQTTPVAAIPTVPAAAFVPTAAVPGFGAYIDPSAFGRGGVVHPGIMPATIGPIAPVPVGMIPTAMGPMQAAAVVPCHPGMAKAMAPSGYFVQDGSFMVQGMAPRDAITTAVQQSPQTVSNSAVTGSLPPQMPKQVFLSQPSPALHLPTAFQPLPTGSAPMEASTRGGLRKSQSTPSLSTMSRTGTVGQRTAPAASGDGAEVQKIGRLTAEERRQKVLRYRQKRHERKFEKRVTYQCRKTLADSRPRVRGRFARNNDQNAVLPHQTKKAIAARQALEEVAKLDDSSMDMFMDLQLGDPADQIVPKLEFGESPPPLENVDHLLKTAS